MTAQTEAVELLAFDNSYARLPNRFFARLLPTPVAAPRLVKLNEMLAYTRYVLDAGMRGDLLALKVALAPCVIGYAEIAARLAARPEACAATNPYRAWIAEYAGAPYQEVAARAQAHLDRLADLYATPAREAELVAIFKEAARLETNFWQMAWLKGQSIE